ncbi:DUF378 domain-containing protein [Candidatus Peregrinibacteria bacterium]|nr:DUF378 domain-containing protein [Candidatus Peregrinibacteria bacterium]
MKCKKCPLCCTLATIVIIGGLNWGLVALGYFLGTNANIVNLVFANSPLVENIVYAVVGVAAIMKVITYFFCPCSKCCQDGKEGEEGGSCCRK